MKSFYKKSMLAASMLVAGTFFAGAVDYITAPMNVTPPNNSVTGAITQVQISWPGVELQMNNRDKDAPIKDNLISTSYVTVTLNGDPITLDGSMMGGRVYTHVTQESNEQLGGGEGNFLDVLTIDLPDMLFWRTGNLQIEIKEGAVTSTTGAINPAISLNYITSSINMNGVWEPAADEESPVVIFNEGDCKIYASWEGCTDLKILSGANPFYQLENEENNGDQISATKYMSVVDGKVMFDFSDFGPGVYILCLPQGAIDLGNNVLNGELTYNFAIQEIVAPNYFLSIAPSQYDWFDAVSVKWGNDPTQPYTISSDYLIYNEDSQKYIFNAEGISLIDITCEGEKLDIAQVALEEYQEDEDTPNYDNAQLLITLSMLEFSVGSTYEVYIPAGIVTLTDADGNKSPNGVVEYSFVLRSSDAYELPAPVATPIEGKVEQLSTVMLTWAGSIGGYDLLNLNPDCTDHVEVLVDGVACNDFAVSLDWSSEEAITDGAEGDTFIVTFEPALADDCEVEIVVPAGYLMVSDIDKGSYYNELVTLKYTVETDDSGVAAIVGNGNSYKVVSLQGATLLETADPAKLNGLAKGIYIINGKKVLVK